MSATGPQSELMGISIKHENAGGTFESCQFSGNNKVMQRPNTEISKRLPLLVPCLDWRYHLERQLKHVSVLSAGKSSDWESNLFSVLVCKQNGVFVFTVSYMISYSFYDMKSTSLTDDRRIQEDN